MRSSRHRSTDQNKKQQTINNNIIKQSKTILYTNNPNNLKQYQTTEAQPRGPAQPCGYGGCQKPGSSICSATRCGDHCSEYTCPRHGDATHRVAMPEIVRRTPKNNNRRGKASSEKYWGRHSSGAASSSDLRSPPAERKDRQGWQ